MLPYIVPFSCCAAYTAFSSASLVFGISFVVLLLGPLFEISLVSISLFLVESDESQNIPTVSRHLWREVSYDRSSCNERVSYFDQIAREEEVLDGVQTATIDTTITTVSFAWRVRLYDCLEVEVYEGAAWASNRRSMSTDFLLVPHDIHASGVFEGDAVSPWPVRPAGGVPSSWRGRLEGISMCAEDAETQPLGGAQQRMPRTTRCKDDGLFAELYPGERCP